MLKNNRQKVYSNKIKSECGLDVSAKTIRRHLSNMGMRYRNVKRKIFLTKGHNEKGLKLLQSGSRRMIIGIQPFLVMKRDSH